MFFGSKETLTGLDIGSASIKILQLKQNRSKYKIERFGVKALTICAVSDDLIRHEFMSADERQTSLKEMITLALDVAVE